MRTRRYMLTQMNPEKYELNFETVKNIMHGFKSIKYWCYAEEIGAENGTPHFHLYLVGKNAIRSETINNAFPHINIQPANGTSIECKEYVSKTGKWEDTKKKDTVVEGTFYEEGEVPIEHKGKRNDLDEMYQMIKDGFTDIEMCEDNSLNTLRLDKIDRVRQGIRYEQFKDKWRELEVVYIWGASGTGKTRGVMEKYGYSSVYRVTDYSHPWDSYNGQDVVIFEEFRGQLKISDMLNYLDGYPLELPCRYVNKIACFTKVYIITNIPLKEQYNGVQRIHENTVNAFYRRIHEVRKYTKSGDILISKPNEKTSHKDIELSAYDLFGKDIVNVV